MRNFKNNRRRYRSNSYDRNFKNSSNDKSFNTSLSNISDFKKKNFPRNNVNCSKLIQKYTDLAREALSSGDKILSENYMQHAEHFVRISENNISTTNSKNNSSDTTKEVNLNNIKEEENLEDRPEKAE
tara:strand:+ start:584 stop:967 length:384 start_codon:yes stop_codon:yes gene_type:complete